MFLAVIFDALLNDETNLERLRKRFYLRASESWTVQISYLWLLDLLTRRHLVLRKDMRVSLHSACFQPVTNFAKALPGMFDKFLNNDLGK